MCRRLMTSIRSFGWWGRRAVEGVHRVRGTSTPSWRSDGAAGPSLWDSSAVLALLDRDDPDHEAAREVATRLARGRRRSFVTNYVEVETHALLLRKLGRGIARGVVADGQSAHGAGFAA